MLKQSRGRTSRGVVALIVSAGTLLVGCSVGDGVTSVRAGQQAGTGGIPTTTAPDDQTNGTAAGAPDEITPPVSPTIPGLPREAPAPPPIPPIEPIESQLKNDNVRDGGLGSLCWARWEVNRQIRLGVSTVEKPGGFDEAQGAVDTLKEELPNIHRDLGAIMSQLPQQVQPFAARLRSDVLAAQGEVQREGGVEAALEALARQFDFDSYPQVEEYRRLAAEHGACEHL